MTSAISNIKNAHSNMGDYIDELERELEELEEYQAVFDEPYEARDAKDYMEEMSDIFDDTYDAQQAKDLAEAAEYAGWDDPSDIEQASEELERYRDLGDIDEVTDAVTNSDGGTLVLDLEKQVEELTAELNKAKDLIAQGIELENRRVRAIHELRGVTVEQAEIDRLAAEEKAYECGLNDGILVKQDMGTTVPLDIIVAPEADDEA